MNQCNSCSKVYQHRQSLWKHKQRCCQSRKGDASEDLFGEEKSEPYQHKMREQHYPSIQTNSDDSDDKSIDDENNMDQSSSEYDDDCSESNDWIWEKLVMISCYNDRYSSLDLFKTYIRFHIDSQSNSLFQSIMSDVSDSELHEISLQKAIQFAVKMNAESITDVVNRCNENDDDWFWCGLAEQRGELNCQWLDGEPCNCTEHNGISMLDTTSFFVKLFIDMEKDDLIEEIESDIKQKSREMSLNDAINQIVTNRKDEILSAFREARKTVDAFGIWKRNIFLQ